MQVLGLSDTELKMTIIQILENIDTKNFSKENINKILILELNSETKYANLVDSFKSRLQWKKASILKDQDKLSC